MTGNRREARKRRRHRLAGGLDPQRELDEELAFHLEERTEELLRTGLEPDEAAAQAQREFGDLEATHTYCEREDRRRNRRARSARIMRTLRDELVTAVRSLVRRPRSVIVPVSILAVAVTLNVLVFTVVRGVLLTPLPFHTPGRVAVVREATPDVPASGGVSYPVLTAWRRQATAATVAGYLGDHATLAVDATPHTVQIAYVTAGFFGMLDRPLLLGRSFTVEEHRRDGPRAAVISEGLWRRLFGADPAVLRRSVRIDGKEYPMVGVVRSGAVFPDNTEVWTPVEVGAPQVLDVVGAKIMTGLAEMRSGVGPTALSADLARISSRVSDRTGVGASEVRTTPLEEYLLGNVRRPLLLLEAAVLLVLFTACANAGGMLLARGVHRRSEMAVRASLGAGGRRIGGALLLEGLLLGAAAAGLGLAGAAALMHPVLGLIPPGIPRADTIHMRPDIVLFAAGLAVLTGIFTALAPTLTGSRTSPAAMLRDTTAAGTTPWLRRLLEGFVVMQVALAVLLSVGAGLLLRSFVATVRVDPGFDPDRVTVVNVQLPETRYPDGASWVAFAHRLLDRATQLPGEKAAAVGRNLPISSTTMTSPLMVEGSTKPTDPVQVAQVSATYFDVLHIPIVAGSGFGAADHEGGPPELVVGREVRTAGGRPVGPGDRAHSFFGPDMSYREVVGVVGSVRHDGLREAPPPTVYEPFFQRGGSPYFSLLVRSDAPAGAVASAARSLVRSLDPALPVDGVTTMDARISRSLAQPRFYTIALSAFGVLALLLALVGCQAGLAHRVAARRREIAVRMALGASSLSARGMILRRGLALTVAGGLLGLGAAIPATRLLDSQLYGVTPGDPITYVGILALLAMTAVLASDIPARRASATDPAEVLREG